MDTVVPMLAIARALATDRGSLGELLVEDFVMAPPTSVLACAWHDAGVAVAATPGTGSMNQPYMKRLQEMMREAVGEIRRLRSANEILQGKVDMVEFLQTVLHTRPNETVRGYAPDIAWQLEDFASKLPIEKKEAA